MLQNAGLEELSAVSAVRLMCGAVAHVKVGAVTGLEARLALQKGREEVQRLSKLLQQSVQQQQQQPPLRTPSFPPRGGPGPIGPIGPSTKVAQVCCQLPLPLLDKWSQFGTLVIHCTCLALLSGCKLLEIV
jgi:hypothetical protein